jgi:hypothetical protein
MRVAGDWSALLYGKTLTMPDDIQGMKLRQR